MGVVRSLFAAALAVVLVAPGAWAQQRRRAPAAQTRTPAPQTRRQQSQQQQQESSLLTGVYRLDESRSDRPRAVARRASSELVFADRREVVDELAGRLSPPYQISIRRRGQSIEIASTRAPRISFVADGREQTERSASGQTVRTRAVLYGDQLMVTSQGVGGDDFSVNFDPLDSGRRLRVTRRVFSQELNRPVLIQSVYDKVSPVARWTVYGEQPPAPPPAVASRRGQTPAPRQSVPAPADRRQNPQPPVITRRLPPEPAPPGLPDIRPGTRFVATLNNDLTTDITREGDPFTMTVRAPSQFDGATLEGRVARVRAGGRVTGRPEMTLAFERLRLRDGRTVAFSGTVEGVRAEGGEDVRVDNESGGSVEEDDSQGRRTAERVAIGAAVGAIIGAISGGGRGAVIGAAVGAGAGAGSVYAQGRDHLELRRGTEFTVAASAPR